MRSHQIASRLTGLVLASIFAAGCSGPGQRSDAGIGVDVGLARPRIEDRLPLARRGNHDGQTVSQSTKAEVPGLETKDFDISLDGRILTIKGQKKEERKKNEETYYRVERSYGYFNRTIQLPAEVNPDKVDATYQRGILKIKLQKAKDSGTRRIKITTG